MLGRLLSGTTCKVSQLFFPESFKQSIYDTQPEYRAASGAGYVPNSNDNVLSQSGMSASAARVEGDHGHVVGLR